MSKKRNEEVEDVIVGIIFDEELKALNKWLKARRGYTHAIDGTFGPATAKALNEEIDKHRNVLNTDSNNGFNRTTHICANAEPGEISIDCFYYTEQNNNDCND